MSRILYAAFDVVPGPKGAAVHIEQFARTLGDAFDSLELVTVSPSHNIRERTVWNNVRHTELPAIGEDLIARVMHFRSMLDAWLKNRTFDIVHIRSPYEGLWLALQKGRFYKQLVYEVNGLPSIELKYRYPGVIEDAVLMEKLVQQERACLEAADLVITTCEVTRKHLQNRGVPADLITVIPNGVPLDTFSYAEPRGSFAREQSLELIYFGTLAGWQGIEVAMRAVSFVAEDTAVNFTLIGPASERRIRELNVLAETLKIGALVKVLPSMTQEELVAYIHRADAVLAPLTYNDRNVEQGCCPMKVLEGMATGTPVIASDLEVVREIADEQCLLFAKANAAGSWKECILQLKNEPESNVNRARAARARVERDYTWKIAGERLVAAYTNLLSKLSMTV